MYLDILQSGCLMFVLPPGTVPFTTIWACNLSSGSPSKTSKMKVFRGLGHWDPKIRYIGHPEPHGHQNLINYLKTSPNIFKYLQKRLQHNPKWRYFGFKNVPKINRTLKRTKSESDDDMECLSDFDGDVLMEYTLSRWD